TSAAQPQVAVDLERASRPTEETDDQSIANSSDESNAAASVPREFRGSSELSVRVISGLIQKINGSNQAPPAAVGANVTLYALTDDVPRLQFVADAITNGDGQVTFRNLAEMRNEQRLDRLTYVLLVERDGQIVGIRNAAWLRASPNMWVSSTDAIKSVKGRVVNAVGRPVADAMVFMNVLGQERLPGIFETRTDAEGRFELHKIPFNQMRAEDPLRVSLGIQHPSYLPLEQIVEWDPNAVELKVRDGARLRGTIVDDVTGKPASSVRVTALPDTPTGDIDEDYREFMADTDDSGNYSVVVTPGRYHIIAEAQDRVAIAAKSVEVTDGQDNEVPAIHLIEGGWIEGRIVNPATGDLVSYVPRSPRRLGREEIPMHISLGHYGPAYPRQARMMSSMPIALVDAEGRFRMRVAPGENYPYVVNTQADRMMWDTLEQSPVVVESGKTTTIELRLKLPIQPDDVRKAIDEVLAQLPQDRAARIDKIVSLLHEKATTADQLTIARMCTLIRELARLGIDAVPELCDELDKEIEPRIIRSWAFALRAIGDPRAVPALIRAIPRTLVSTSDFGLMLQNEELVQFMQTHDLDDGERGNRFNLGVPIREVCGAIRKLTGHSLDDDAYYWISETGDSRIDGMRRHHLYLHADQWRRWWLEHGVALTDDERYRGMEPLLPVALVTNSDVDPSILKIPVGSRLLDVSTGMTLSPPSEAGIHLLDLDTGYKPAWPDDVPRLAKPENFRKLAVWSAPRGVDLMCVEHPLGDARFVYSLQGFDLRAWRIDSRDATRVDAMVGQGKLPEGDIVEGPLLPHIGDDESDAMRVSYLFLTREGTLGVLRLTDQITQAKDLTGRMMAERGVGFHRGVKFNIYLIAGPTDATSP
ncbi:MAG: carboxypeptidase regulatory-like domain-containing protein, partial [Planctomycetales bacterium]|nr:carboxypeptidase regulatory-like domain-containing protein [Planctomycetales bacterium]